MPACFQLGWRCSPARPRPARRLEPHHRPRRRHLLRADPPVTPDPDRDADQTPPRRPTPRQGPSAALDAAVTAAGRTDRRPRPSAAGSLDRRRPRLTIPPTPGGKRGSGAASDASLGAARGVARHRRTTRRASADQTLIQTAARSPSTAPSSPWLPRGQPFLKEQAERRRPGIE
jgi:hypothetical protein